jgi:hypothetical protein
MPSQVESAADPDAIMLLDVIQETRQAGSATGVTDHAHVQAD